MDNITAYIKGLVLGDALGSVYEGMSRGHIMSHFRDVRGFPDTIDAQKGHYDRWRKPGLYGGLSQLFIIAAFLGSERPCDYKLLKRFLSGKGRVLDTTSGVFRAPGRFLEEYLISVYSGQEDSASYDLQSASALPVVTGGFYTMLSYACPPATDIIAYARSMYADMYSSIGSALYSFLLHRIFVANDDTPVRMAAEESRRLSSEIAENQPELFKAGVNPDRCMEAARAFTEVFEAASDAKGCDDAEKRIVCAANQYLKTSVTRATVDHPLLIFPFAAALVSGSAESSLYSASRCGGSCTVLTAMTGAMSGAVSGDTFPEELESALVNRKNIRDYAERIAAGNGGEGDAGEFFDNEIALTSKEIDEKEAKLKHLKVPERKKRTIAEKEAFLTRHVVESWTKSDKAKWRKTLRNNDDEILE